MILSLNGIIAGRGITPSTLLTNLRNVYKAESNANDSYGTVNGTGMGGLTYSSGKSGSAFNFNGSTAYVNFADDSFNFTGDFSVNLWIYFPSSPAGAQYDIIQSVRQNSINTGWKFVIRQGKPEFQIYNNSSQFVAWYTAGLDLIANTWYNLSIVKKTGQAPTIMSNGSYYTVGVRASNSSITEPQYTSPCYSVIGSAKYDTGSLGNYMPSNSKLDEIGLWNRALTTAEETELYKCSLGNFYPFTITPALDSDACAFIGSASITDITQQSAINQLVLDLKSANIWTKMKAIYPFVGGTASQHRFNLKDPRTLTTAYYITFGGGGTHSSQGYLPDGATAYANTNLNPATAISTGTSVHFSLYCNTNAFPTVNGGFKVDGVYQSSPLKIMNLAFWKRNTGVTTYYAALGGTTEMFIDTVTPTTQGFTLITRTSSTSFKLFQNGTLLGTNTTSETNGLPNYNMYLGARNGDNVIDSYNNLPHQFASIGDGLSDSEANAFRTAVLNFNTTLNRQ